MSRTGWRFVCPTANKHVTIFRRNDSFYCKSCGKQYDKIKDLKKDRFVKAKNYL